MTTNSQVRCSRCGTVQPRRGAEAQPCIGCDVTLRHTQPPAPLAAPVFRCPYCQSAAGYEILTKVSTQGCIVSVVLLILFFPLCWIGLLMKDETRHCRACRMKLG